MFNPFRKKQFAEEQREPYLPPDLEKFKLNEPAGMPLAPLEIPERQRKFRAFAREMESADSGPKESDFPYLREESFRAERSVQEGKPSGDKLDMILQKLETIDLRLKLIEQKIERRPI